MSRPSPLTTAACCIAFALWLLPGAVSAQEGEVPDDGPDWIPSIGVGFGIYTRDVTASVEGVRSGTFFPRDPFLGNLTVNVRKGFLTLTTEQPGSVSGLGNARSCTTSIGTWRPAQPRPGICGPFEDVGNDSLDGGAPSFHAQLLGPSWRTAPLRPRPFVQGLFALPLSSRLVAKDGFKATDFDVIGSEPQVRIEMEAAPQNFWLAGGGVAFLLPWERYDVRAKLGLSYMQEEIDVTSRGAVAVRTANNSCGDDPDLVQRQQPIAETSQQKQSLTIRSLTPSIGLEADLARFGPVMLSISADTYLSVALGGTSAAFNFETPRINRNCSGATQGTGFVDGSFQADDLHIFGTIGVRFGWVGFGR